MIKTRQRNLKLFEFESGASTEEYIAFITKHLPLLRYHTLGFKGEIDSVLKEFLQSHQLSFSTLDTIYTFQSPQQKESKDSKLNAESQKTSSIPSAPTLFVSKVVRSGEEIIHNGDVVIESQVNDGARVIAGGNLAVFGECSGSVEVSGEYMICKKILSSAIIFQDRLLDEPFLHKINQSSALFKIIFKKDDDIVIKDLL